MDSEQAVWAKQWIQSECDLFVFEKGWTYMFEIIYTDNIVVIDYPFEGLVLLAVTNADGVEIPSSHVYYIAKRAGFTLASQLFQGTYSQIKEICRTVKEEKKTGVKPSLLVCGMSCEGWVIRDGNGSRTKLVSKRYKASSRQASLIHPQLIWLLVRQNQLQEYISSLERHLKEEVKEIQKCILRQFLTVLLIICHGIEGESLPKLEDIFRTMNLSDSGESNSKTGVSNENKCDSLNGRANKHLLEDQIQETLAAPNSGDDGELKSKYQLCLETSSLTLLWQNDFFGKCHTPSGTDDSSIYQKKMTEVFSKLMSVDERFKNLVMFVKLQLKDEDVLFIRNQLMHRQLNIFDHNINITPVFREGKNNKLRVPVLDYIRPCSHILEGYEPSSNFKQTRCKGWKPLGNIQDNIQLVLQSVSGCKQQCLLLYLPVEVICRILEFLGGQDLKAIRMCSKDLCAIIDSPGNLFRTIVSENKINQIIRENQRSSFLGQQYFTSSGYGSDEDYHHCCHYGYDTD